MSAPDNISTLPATIVRAIEIYPVREEPGQWQGWFKGGGGLSSFMTPPAPKQVILRAFECRDVRRGLPIVVNNTTAPRRGQWAAEGELVA